MHATSALKAIPETVIVNNGTKRQTGFLTGPLSFVIYIGKKKLDAAVRSATLFNKLMLYTCIIGRL